MELFNCCHIYFSFKRANKKFYFCEFFVTWDCDFNHESNLQLPPGDVTIPTEAFALTQY